MKANELRDKSTEELEVLLKEIRSHLFKLKNETQLSKDSKNRVEMRAKRKDIARLLTVINEKDVLSN